MSTADRNYVKLFLVLIVVLEYDLIEILKKVCLILISKRNWVIRDQ